MSSIKYVSVSYNQLEHNATATCSASCVIVTSKQRLNEKQQKKCKVKNQTRISTFLQELAQETIFVVVAVWDLQGRIEWNMKKKSWSRKKHCNYLKKNKLRLIWVDSGDYWNGMYMIYWIIIVVTNPIYSHEIQACDSHFSRVFFSIWNCNLMLFSGKQWIR